MPKVKRKEGNKGGVSTRSDTWDELCGERTIEGRKIAKIEDLEGVPAHAYLSGLIEKAGKLKLKDPPQKKSKGIAFHIVQAVGDPPSYSQRYNEFVGSKQGSSVCYENQILPHEAQWTESEPGHLVIHQSVAPCTRCRAGYAAWTKKRHATIVVYADEGYDQAPANSVFIFTPAADVVYL